MIFLDCECNLEGSLSYQCEENGTCTCKTNVGGKKCTKCLDGYFYDFPNCNLGINLLLFFSKNLTLYIHR